MKKYFLFVLCFLLMAFYPVFNSLKNMPVFAEGNKITVIGVGEITAIPDLAKIRFGVETKNESLSIAEKENSKKISELTKILESNNIDINDIKTTGYNVYTQYDYKEITPSLTSYQVSNYIEFTTKDLDNISNLISELTQTGANNFSGINFCVEDTTSYYLEALNNAYSNAEQKASTLSNGMKLKVVEVLEESLNNYNIYCENSLIAGASKDLRTIYKGENKITAKVKVVFEVINEEAVLNEKEVLNEEII